MSDSVIFVVAYAASALVAIGFEVLASYIGFSLNRVLGSKTHRNRALWMGISSVVFTVYLMYVALELTEPFLAGELYILRPFAVVVLFVVVFTTIRVAFDEDFLHRNTLYWGSLGWVTLFLVLVLTSADAIFWYGAGLSIEVDLWAVVLLASAFLYSGGVLLVSSLRTPDPTMRRYVVWLGLTVFAIVVGFGLFFTSYFFIPVAFGSYFFYRAAASLSPTSRRT